MKLRFTHWLPNYFKVEAILLYPFILFAEDKHTVLNSYLFHKEVLRHKLIQEYGVVRFYLISGLYALLGRIKSNPIVLGMEERLEKEHRELELPKKAVEAIVKAL